MVSIDSSYQLHNLRLKVAIEYRERERKREIVILYDYDYFLFSSFDWVTESTLADMWIFISGTKIGVKISQYYDFAPQQNRSLSFQFPKLYAIQMPAEVVNFQKQKEKVWLVHERSSIAKAHSDLFLWISFDKSKHFQ